MKSLKSGAERRIVEGIRREAPDFGDFGVLLEAETGENHKIRLRPTVRSSVRTELGPNGTLAERNFAERKSSVRERKSSVRERNPN